MEYSLARSLDGYSEIYNVPFPHLSADPPIDNVNPGLGQIVNLFETIVPVRGQSQHVLEKKMESTQEDMISNDQIATNQVGTGEKKIDQEILKSFKNPIVTDSIIFPKQTQKHKLGNVEIKHELPNKKPKIKKESHKFQIV